MDDRPNRSVRVVMIIAVILTLASGFVLYHTYSQPYHEARITKIGEVRSVRHRKTRTRSAYTSYVTTLQVTWEEGGTLREAPVEVSYRGSVGPKIGGTVRICAGLFGGIKPYPQETVRTIGWTVLGISVVTVGLMLYSFRWSARAISERSRLTESREAGEQLPEIEGMPKAEEISDRVAQFPDGSIRWIGEMDEDYIRGTQHTGYIIGGIISALILVMGFVVSGGETEIMWIMSGTAVALFLIIVGCTWGAYKMPGSRSMRYELNDLYIRIGYGRSSQFMDWHRIQRIQWGANQFVAEGRKLKRRVFVPPEDMHLVQQYTRMRMITGTEETEM